jgi:hypothetical protein
MGIQFILLFVTLFLMLLEVKSFVWQQDFTSKDIYNLIHFKVKSKLGLKSVL